MLKTTIILLLAFFLPLAPHGGETNDLIKIIQYGSYAPSSHNAQMWNIKIAGKNIIKITPDKSRTLPYVDPKDRETWISIGAFVENCVLSAQDFGYNSKVTINTKEVLISFHPDTRLVKTTRNIDLIKKRRTIREPYLDVNLDDSIIKKATRLAENIFYFPVNTEKGRKIIEYSLDAYNAQMRDTLKLNELAQWMTFSYKEEKQEKDGMTPNDLGITGIKHFFFNLFMNEQSVTGKTFIKGSVSSAKKQFHACSGYILITSHGFNNADLIETGRILERFWLECTNNKIAVQPMSQILEEQQYYQSLKSALNIDGEIQMLLRVGKVKNYPERTKRRLDVKQIIVE